MQLAVPFRQLDSIATYGRGEIPSRTEQYMDIWAVVITAFISPLVLKMAEFVMNKSSQAERERNQREEQTAKRIDALGRRIDELRDDNTKLMIQAETQQRIINEQAKQIKDQAEQIEGLRKDIEERDRRILELEMVNARGAKHNDNS
jgi:septal ring factor EnvC (AmiA/AmiB activator)